MSSATVARARGGARRPAEAHTHAPPGPDRQLHRVSALSIPVRDPWPPQPLAAPASATAAPHTASARCAPTARIAPHVSTLTCRPRASTCASGRSRPGDQGAVSSCVTWAIDYGMLGWYSRLHRRAGQPFAPMYTYSQINGGSTAAATRPRRSTSRCAGQRYPRRLHPGRLRLAGPADPRRAHERGALQDQGLRDAVQRRGPGQECDDSSRTRCAAKHPVAIEMAVRNGFESLGSNPAAVDDDITSGILGYHEVLAVGYDAAGLIIENSWGTGWANGGFGRLSWRVVQTTSGKATRSTDWCRRRLPPRPRCRRRR